MSTTYPVVIFAYHRPDALAKVLHRLQRCWGIGKRDLYIFCDGPRGNTDDERRSIDAVRQLAQTFKWPGQKHIIEQQTNLGLARSVISGVNLALSAHPAAIVLEDDILVSRTFLKFFDQALSHYQSDNRVAGVTGYSYGNLSGYRDNYFLPIGCSWSWGTWRRVWDQIEWNTDLLVDEFVRSGKDKDFHCGRIDYFGMLTAQQRGQVDSWAIRYLASFWLKEQLFLYPKRSLAINIGFGEGATHTFSRSPIHTTKYYLRWSAKMPPAEVKPQHMDAIRELFSTA